MDHKEAVAKQSSLIKSEQSDSDIVTHPPNVADYINSTFGDWMVAFKLLGLTFGKKQSSLLIFQSAIHEGFPWKSAEKIKKELELDEKKLAMLLGISTRTLSRRKEAKVLLSAESDRLLRVARVASRAGAVFEDLEIATEWLNEPNAYLENHSPLELLETEIGSNAVLTLLEQIDAGVYR